MEINDLFFLSTSSLASFGGRLEIVNWVWDYAWLNLDCLFLNKQR